MIETLLLYGFGGAALAGAVTMLVARHPMRAALGLIGTMLSLACLYALLQVHVVAVFQVLIYVGAVMVFMVFVIMLLDTRDASFVGRYSPLLVPGVLVATLLAAGLGALVARQPLRPPSYGAVGDFHLQAFSRYFLRDYWLHFELSSVLLLVVIAGVIAVVRGRGGRDG